MQEIIGQGLTYLWGIWRHRWVAIVVAWVVAIGGWYYVYNMPESYVAKAKVYVDTNSVLRPLLRGIAITPDVNQRISLMSRMMLSTPNLEKLARMTDLDLNVANDTQMQSLVRRLRSAIRVSGERRNASMYNITVRHKDRETARRITQSLITVFIENSLNDKRDDSSGAQDFLEEQIADYERRLIEAEGRLARFKQQNVDVLPGKGGGYYARLQQARGELNKVNLDLEAATKRRDALQEQLASGTDSVAKLRRAGVVTPTEARIQQLRGNIDVLLAKYTDKHPQIRQMKKLIAELEAERDAEYEEISQGDGGVIIGAGSSSTKSLLAEAEGQVAELTVRAREYQRRADDLGNKVNQIPEIEAQLKQLDRDYGVIQRQHTELLKRRESARLSQNVEDTGGEVTFRVIEPPFVPNKPSEPKKPPLYLMALGAGLAAGGGVALLLALLRPIVVDPRMLADTTGLPLLGVVTQNKQGAERRRDLVYLAAFSMVTLALFIAYAGMLNAPKIIAAVTGA